MLHLMGIISPAMRLTTPLMVVWGGGGAILQKGQRMPGAHVNVLVNVGIG